MTVPEVNEQINGSIVRRCQASQSVVHSVEDTCALCDWSQTLAHSPPSLISKMVLSTVYVGGLDHSRRDPSVPVVVLQNQRVRVRCRHGVDRVAVLEAVGVSTTIWSSLQIFATSFEYVIAFPVRAPLVTGPACLCELPIRLPMDTLLARFFTWRNDKFRPRFGVSA